MAKSIVLSGLGAMLLIPCVAGAAPFASHGTVAIGVERVFGVEHTSQTEKQNGVEDKSSSTSISLLGRYPGTLGPLNPSTALTRFSVDGFLGPGVSLGGSLMYNHVGASYGDNDDRGFNLILLAPRVGFGANLSDKFAIWPRLGVTYMHSWSSRTTETQDTQGNTTTRDVTTTYNYTLLSLDALFVYTPFEHVGFSFGPSFDYLLGISGTSDGNDLTLPDTSMYSLGVHAGLLVWL